MKKGLKKLIGILPLLLLMSVPNSYANNEVGTANIFHVDVIQADNAELGLAKNIKTIMSFSGALELTKDMRININTPNSHLKWTSKKAYAVTFQKKALSQTIKYSGRCPNIKGNKPEYTDAFKMTIISPPNQPSTAIYYSYMEAGEGRATKLGDCEYVMPVTFKLESMQDRMLSAGHEVIMFAGKSNGHYIYFKISRSEGAVQ